MENHRKWKLDEPISEEKLNNYIYKILSDIISFDKSGERIQYFIKKEKREINVSAYLHLNGESTRKKVGICSYRFYIGKKYLPNITFSTIESMMIETFYKQTYGKNQGELTEQEQFFLINNLDRIYYSMEESKFMNKDELKYGIINGLYKYKFLTELAKEKIHSLLLIEDLRGNEGLPF